MWKKYLNECFFDSIFFVLCKDTEMIGGVPSFLKKGIDVGNGAYRLVLKAAWSVIGQTALMGFVHK